MPRQGRIPPLPPGLPVDREQLRRAVEAANQQIERDYGLAPTPPDDDSPEHQVEGEPEPQDNAPASPLPTLLPELRIQDAITAAIITPQMVRDYRPRWSLERCRAWLLDSQSTIHREMRPYVNHVLQDLTGRTTTRLRMDEEVENRPRRMGRVTESTTLTGRIPSASNITANIAPMYYWENAVRQRQEEEERG